MKQYIILLVAFAFSSSLWAQHPGFSKRYRYLGDTLLRAESASTLYYDTAGHNFFLCSGGALISSGTFYSSFYKLDDHGNVVKELIDSLYYGSVGYYCVTESPDGQYLYWGGYSFIYGDTTTTSWKIRKTDKNLNVVWDKFYHSQYGSNVNTNIIFIDSTRLMLSCYDFTGTNSVGLPFKPETPLMRIIDTAGNIVSETRPLELDYTNAAGLSRTNDGGSMVNGNINFKAYHMKTDSAGNYVWYKIQNTGTPKSWFDAMVRQQSTAEKYFNAGGVLFLNNNGVALAMLTDSAGNEIWQRHISKNGMADEFFSVASGQDQNATFSGVTYFPEGQFNRGWMVKLDADGNEVWNKLYSTPHRESDPDYLYKVVALPDGGYAAAGSTFAQDVNGNWTQHAWLLRVDSNGCYDSACTEYTAIKQAEAPKETINLFPNPSPGPLHLLKTTPFPAGTIVTLCDLSGKMIRTLESSAGKTQQVYQLRGGLLPGMYLLRIAMDDQIIEKKWVLMY